MIVAGHLQSGYKSRALRGRGWRLRGLGQPAEGSMCTWGPPCNPPQPCSMMEAMGVIQGGKCVQVRPGTYGMPSLPPTRSLFPGSMPAYQGGPCAYTSSGGQVMPGIWDTRFGCAPILHSNPIQAVNVPSGGPTVLAPGTSVQAPGTTTTSTTTTSYVPWIIGAAVVLVVIFMVAR